MCSYLQSAPLLVGRPVVGKIEKEEEGYKQWSYSTRHLFRVLNCFVGTFLNSPTYQPPLSSTLATVFGALSARICSQYCQELHMTNSVSPFSIKVKKVDWGGGGVVIVPPLSLDRGSNRDELVSL